MLDSNFSNQKSITLPWSAIIIIDIKLSAHDAFLEEHSPGTLKAKIFQSQNIFKSLEARK